MSETRGSKGKKKKKGQYFDYTLLTVVLFLLGIGLVMLYSVSTYDANLTFHDPMYYLKKQVIATIVGIVFMFIVMSVNYHLYSRLAIIAYILSVILIFLILTPLGYEANGAKRWLDLGFSLQPAEAAKLGMIVFYAAFVCKSSQLLDSVKGNIILALPGIFVAGQIYIITKNLSSALIVLGICFVMFFVGSEGYKQYVIIVLLIAFAAGILILLVMNNWLPEDTTFRITRIRAWLYPEAYANSKSFQTIQALYAIGSGGIFGKGLGTSLQKKFVPEAQNDMIFAIVCEELGLFGAVLIIFLFIVLIWRLIVIANNAPDSFGSMLVIGVVGHISLQVILNLAVVTNSIPNTGISLPFISYGGSSVVFLLMEMGIVLSVAKNTIYDS